MWYNDYELMSNGDQERFRSIANYLLNKTFVVSEVYEPRDRIGKINGNYRFIERYFSVFESFLDLAGYELLKDDARGIIYITSKYNNNIMHLDKSTTLFLLVARQIYDEEQEKDSSKNVVFCQVSDIILRMIEDGIIIKKPTIKETVDTLRLLMKYNIIARIEGEIQDTSCTIAIYQTITKVISNEKITAIYNVMFKQEEVAQEGFDFDNKEDQ